MEKNRTIAILKYLYINGTDEQRDTVKKRLVEMIKSPTKENFEEVYWLIISGWDKERTGKYNYQNRGRKR